MREKMEVGEGKKKREILASHPSGPHLRGPTFGGLFFHVLFSHLVPFFFQKEGQKIETPIWAKVGLGKVGQLRLAKVGLAKVGLGKVGISRSLNVRIKHEDDHWVNEDSNLSQIVRPSVKEDSQKTNNDTK